MARKKVRRVLWILIALAAWGWTKKIIDISGSYLKEEASVRFSGETATGSIKSVVKNLRIELPGNYLARVSYTTTNGGIFHREFRYGTEVTNPDSLPPVTVIYSPENPQVAALKDDGGYLAGTLSEIGLIFGILLLFFIGVFWV